MYYSHLIQRVNTADWVIESKTYLTGEKKRRLRQIFAYNLSTVRDNE